MSYQLWKDSLTEQAEIVIKEKWPAMANQIHDSIDNKKLDSSRVPEVRRAGIKMKSATNGHGEKVVNGAKRKRPDNGYSTETQKILTQLMKTRPALTAHLNLLTIKLFTNSLKTKNV